MNQFSRNVALWLVLGLMILLLFQLLTKQQTKLQDVSYSDFVAAVDKGEVTDVEIEGQNIRGRFHSSERFKTYAPEDPDLVKMLRNKDVKIIAKPEVGDPWYVVAFVQWFPVLLLIGVWIFFMRQMQVGGGDENDALVGLEAVHLDEELVQRLLALVMAAAHAGAAMAAMTSASRR